MLKVAKMDTVAKTFTFAEAGMYGLISGEDYNRWFVMNMLEELDTPGEYYLDVPNQTVWVYLDKIPESIKVSLLAEPMLSIEGVENVEVRESRSNARAGQHHMERTGQDRRARLPFPQYRYTGRSRRQRECTL